VAGATDFSIVLLGRFAGKDRAVAQALSRAFGRDDAWGLQVVGATPIVLISNLNVDQASAITDALHDVEHAGSKLEIQQGLDDGLPQLQWPATPRIRGRLVSDFGPPPAAHNIMLVVPCPYTQQKIQLTLNITYGKSTDGNPVPNITATTAPYRGTTPAGNAAPIQPIQSIPAPAIHPPISINRPMTPAPQRHSITLPPPIPLPGANPPISMAKTTPNSGTASQGVVIEGLDALDDLAPMDQIPTPTNMMIPASKSTARAATVVNTNPAPPPMPIRPPAPPPIPPPIPKPLTVTFNAKPNSPAPLPDVPVLHNAPPVQPEQPAQMTLSNAMPMPSSMMGVPMDMSAFEASVTGSGLTAAMTDEAAAELMNEAPEASAPVDDGSLYTVVIGKTNNAKVHQIVADLMGISSADAAKLCQKPIISLAKEVPHSEALEIKKRFANANIQVRLSKKR
jgi:ribosomal protein L7/L12